MFTAINLILTSIITYALKLDFFPQAIFTSVESAWCSQIITPKTQLIYVNFLFRIVQWLTIHLPFPNII